MLTISSRWLRVIAHAFIAAFLTVAFVHYGSLSRFEGATSDIVTFGSKRSASGDVLLVVADPSTIEATGYFPFDRALMARAIERLNQAGADRIYVDATLNTAENPVDDALLAKALDAPGHPPIALPFSVSDWSVANLNAIRTPLAPFMASTSLVGTNYPSDVDRRVRQQTPLNPAASTAPDWLAGQDGIRTRPLFVDFSISAASVPRYEMRRVADGSIAPSAFANKKVIVGLDVPSPLYRVHVPLQGDISRAHFLALGAETVLSGHPLQKPNALLAATIIFTLALLVGLLIARLRTLAALGIVLTASAAWLFYLPDLQTATGLLLPTLSVPVATMIVWQTLLFRESTLATHFHKRIVRFMGVGRQALVAAVDIMVEPAFILDGKLNLIGSNEPFRAIIGQLAAGDGEAERIAGLVPRDALEEINVPTDASVRIDCSASFIDGKTRHFEINLRRVMTPSGQLAIAGLKDITEAHEREQALKALAFNDALTGLANRVSFQAALGKQTHANPDGHLAILLIDLDGFKAVNDTLGHHAGDLLLQGFSKRLKGLVRASDVPARLGGDEFAVLQAGGTRESALRLADRLLDAVRDPFAIEGQEARIGVSIGIALWPEHHGEVADVVKLADAAMYVAKAVKPGYAIHTENGPALVRSDRKDPAASAA
ncbi:MAG: diguanylate cyclase [Proteobacteria bacterium]|nr:diguanylate cyclase [Pseudomonadota bacterium]